MARIWPKITKLAEWFQIKATHEVNTRVDVVVVRTAGLGALCEVGPRKIPGLIRSREMSWNPNEQTNTAVGVGDAFPAVVIGHDELRRELLLSRKAADDRPFQQFVAAFPAGSLVNAQVIRSVGEYVVALEAGIEGFIPKTTVDGLERSHQDLTTPWQLLVRDRVRAVVVDHDLAARKVVLSVKDAYDKLEAEYAHQLPPLRTASRRVLARARERRSILPQARFNSPVPDGRKLTVLILDNETDILFSLKCAFEDRGHRVIACTDAATARKALVGKPDVAVLDLQLGGESAEGLPAELHAAAPGMRIFAFTGNVMTAPVRGVIPLIKPMHPDELLAQVEGRVALPTKSDLCPLDEAVDAVVTESVPSMKLAEPTKVVLDRHLRRAIESYFGACVALFMLDPLRNEVVTLHEIGMPRGTVPRMSRQLATSAVGNVLADGAEAVVSQAELANPSDPLMGLFAALRCTQMFGLPMPVDSADSRLGRAEPRIGVFVFLPEKFADLPTEQADQLRARVAALGLAFNRATFDAQVVRNQRVLLASSHVLGMAHELNNILQPIRGNVANLIRWENGRAYPHRSVADYNQTLTSLDERVRQLGQVCQTMLESTRRAEAKTLSLNDLLLNAFETCWASAEQGDVTFVLHDVPPRARGLGYPVGLQQVFINLILNAVQHTKNFRRVNGLVQVAVQYLADGTRPQVEVRVSDNGSGVSGDDLNRVFDMYMTTRRDGSGLGLSVSRLIVESYGGKLEIEESAKFFGSTFLVVLPAH